MYSFRPRSVDDGFAHKSQIATSSPLPARETQSKPQKKPTRTSYKRADTHCLLRGLCIAASPAELVSGSQRSDLNDEESMGKASVAAKEEGKHFKVVSN